MAYLESRFDEANSAGTDPAEVPTRDRSTLASRLGHRGLLVLALAIGVVGLTAYSAIRAQKRVLGDLEAHGVTRRSAAIKEPA